MRELLEQLRQFRDDRDWQQFHTPKDLAISVSVEAGELLELFQWRPPDQKVDSMLVEKVRSEAADVLLYLLLLSDVLNFDLEDAAFDKLRTNAARFPIAASKGVAKPEDVTDHEVSV